MTENYSKSQQKRMAIQRGEATTMTPMSEERLREIFRNKSSCYAEPIDEACVLAMDEDRFVETVNSIFTLPPDVAAAMERYAKHINALVSGFTANSPYWLGLRADGLHWDLGAVSSDQDTIATHFTTLFQKGNQP